VLTYSPTAKLSLMANYDYGQDHFVDSIAVPPITGPLARWSGIAGYIKYAFTDKWTFATRGEYFDDHDGFEPVHAAPERIYGYAPAHPCQEHHQPSEYAATRRIRTRSRPHGIVQRQPEYGYGGRDLRIQRR